MTIKIQTCPKCGQELWESICIPCRERYDDRNRRIIETGANEPETGGLAEIALGLACALMFAGLVLAALLGG